MKICFLGNNTIGLRILEWLAGRGQDIGALVVHTPYDGRCVSEIRELGQKLGCHMFEAPRLHERDVLAQIRDLGCEMAVSVFYGYLLKKSFLDCFPKGAVNLHPALLPYNKGVYSNVWAIVDNTPAGATLHYIDEGLDTGPIIDQRETKTDPWDTGESLYAKQLEDCAQLFFDNWDKVLAGEAQTRNQTQTEGSFHLKKDVESIDCIDLDRSYKAADLINILRARTFPPYKGAYFIHEGKKVHLRLELTPEDE